MAYTPTVWATGDVITAEKLNKAENGIAGAYEIVTLTPTFGTPVYEEQYGEGYVPVSFDEELDAFHIYKLNMSGAPTLTEGWSYNVVSGLYIYSESDSNGIWLTCLADLSSKFSNSDGWTIPTQLIS